MLAGRGITVYPRVLDDLVPSALHIVEQYANNPIEADHGRTRLIPSASASRASAKKQQLDSLHSVPPRTRAKYPGIKQP